MKTLIALAGFLGLFFGALTATGAGLNTNVALTPPQDGTIIRLQWRLAKLNRNLGSPPDLNITTNLIPLTVVHGLTANLAVLATIPFLRRSVDSSSGNTMTRNGIGDIPLLLKYRFFQRDHRRATSRWAILGGGEIPSRDPVFSSGRIDPIIGTVWTQQRPNGWLDWDLIYKHNTTDAAGPDILRANSAISIRLRQGTSRRRGPWGLYGIVEINTQYWTDGRAQMFLSPGLQGITRRWIAEAGIQIPVHQDLSSVQPRSNFTTVVSFRFQF